MQCPKCKLENPTNAMWCDCGYEFSTGKVDEVHKPATIRQRNGVTDEFTTDGYFSFEKMISPTLIKGCVRDRHVWHSSRRYLHGLHRH